MSLTVPVHSQKETQTWGVIMCRPAPPKKNDTKSRQPHPPNETWVGVACQNEINGYYVLPQAMSLHPKTATATTLGPSSL